MATEPRENGLSDLEWIEALEMLIEQLSMISMILDTVDL